MSEAELIVCPVCAAPNRVPANRIEAGPRCGHCKNALFGGAPVEVDAVTFGRHVDKGTIPVLADFWASWCGPCRAMAPAFHAAAHELEPFVRLIKVDTEAEQGLAGRYGIRSIPTLILFSRGKEVARISGALDRAGLVSWARSGLRRL